MLGGVGQVDEIPNEDALRRTVKDKPLAVVGWLRHKDKCNHCKRVTPIFVQLAKRYQRTVYFAKIDVDANRPAAVRHGIDVVPTFFFFRKGVKLSGDTLAGGDVDVLRHKLKKLARAHGQKYFPGQGHQLSGPSSRSQANPWANPNWTPPGMRGTLASSGRKNKPKRPGRIKIPGSGALSRIFNLPTPGKTPKAKPGLFTKLTPRPALNDAAILALTDDGTSEGFGTTSATPRSRIATPLALTPLTPTPRTPLSPHDGRQKPPGHRNKLPPRPRDLHIRPSVRTSDSDDDEPSSATSPFPSLTKSSESTFTMSSRATGSASPRRGVVAAPTSTAPILPAPILVTPSVTIQPMAYTMPATVPVASSTTAAAPPVKSGEIRFEEVSAEQLSNYKPRKPGTSDMGGSNYCWGLDSDFRSFIRGRNKSNSYDVCYYSKVKNVAETINELYGYDWNVENNAGSCHTFQGFCYIVRYSSDAPPPPNRKNVDPQRAALPPLETATGQRSPATGVPEASKNRKRQREDEELESNKRQRRRHEPSPPSSEPEQVVFERPPAPRPPASSYRRPRGVARPRPFRDPDFSIGADGFQDDLPELDQPIGARIFARLFKNDKDTINTAWLRDLMKLGLTRGQARNALLITNNTSFEAARDLLLGAPKTKQDTTRSQYSDFGKPSVNDKWVQEARYAPAPAPAPVPLQPVITPEHLRALKADEAALRAADTKHNALQAQIDMLKNRLQQAQSKNDIIRSNAVLLQTRTPPSARHASAL